MKKKCCSTRNGVHKLDCPNWARDEKVRTALVNIVERNRAVLEALAPHDTRDPERPGWMKCGCCRHPVGD